MSAVISRGRLTILDDTRGTCYISKMHKLIFLKLGGSLITDKIRPFTYLPETLGLLAEQIARACHDRPGLRLILGHGSGSFGHAAASRYQTQNGVTSREEWRGFSEVWFQASSLNRFVMQALHQVGLPAVSFSPASAVSTRDRCITAWNMAPIRSALKNDLLPVIFGDVVFDQALGGTILSTEDLFCHLARRLKPGRILLAGQEEGVWADFPKRETLYKELTPHEFHQSAAGLKDAAGADVTGGMRTKVGQMLELVSEIPSLEVCIFSGRGSDAVYGALLGAAPGTRLHR